MSKPNLVTYLGRTLKVLGWRVGQGADVRTNTIKTCVERRLDCVSETCCPSRFNNQHDWGEMYMVILWLVVSGL